MATKFRITINLDIDEYEALQRISENTERSLAWLGRRAVILPFLGALTSRA